MRPLTMLALLATLCAAARADIVVAPQDVVISSLTDRVTINITKDESLLQPDAIDEITVRIGEDTYPDMFNVNRDEPGILELVPAAELAPGIYDIVIQSGDQSATVRVLAPLQATTTAGTATPPASPTQAPAPNEPAPNPSASTLSAPATAVIPQTLELPAIYYVGQTLVMNRQAPSDYTYRWVVNGDEVSTGAGNSTLVYTFPERGRYNIVYTETDPLGNQTTAQADTLAVTQPPLNMTVEAGEPVTLTGPAGFDEYAWTVDGVMQNEGPALTHTFIERGNHIVSVTARRTTPGNQDAFRIITYNITVI